MSLAKGTIIKTTQGEKRIEDIRIKDSIQTANWIFNRVTNTWTGIPSDGMVKLKQGENKLTYSNRHLIFDSEKYKKAGELSESEIVNDYREHIYNRCRGTRSAFAGILVGTNWTENQLRRAKK